MLRRYWGLPTLGEVCSAQAVGLREDRVRLELKLELELVVRDLSVRARQVLMKLGVERRSSRQEIHVLGGGSCSYRVQEPEESRCYTDPRASREASDGPNQFEWRSKARAKRVVWKDDEIQRDYICPTPGSDDYTTTSEGPFGMI